MIFPYDDINPTDRIPVVTWILIAVNVAVHGYLVTVLFSSAGWEALESLRASYQGCPPVLVQGPVEVKFRNLFYYKYGLVPANMEPVTFLSSMFLHGGLGHLVGNMLFLWITGDNLEDRFGHFTFLAIYLVCGLAAAFAQIAMSGGDCRPMIGASGAIAGAMGSYLLLFPRSKIKIFAIIFPFFIGTLRIDAIWWLGLWIFFQVVSGTAQAPAGGGVAYWAHIGGFAAGFAITLVAWLIGLVEGGVNYAGTQDTWESRRDGHRRDPWDEKRRRSNDPW